MFHNYTTGNPNLLEIFKIQLIQNVRIPSLLVSGRRARAILTQRSQSFSARIDRKNESRTPAFLQFLAPSQVSNFTIDLLDTNFYLEIMGPNFSLS